MAHRRRRSGPLARPTVTRPSTHPAPPVGPAGRGHGQARGSEIKNVRRNFPICTSSPLRNSA
jgi:hypothetical protein